VFQSSPGANAGCNPCSVRDQQHYSRRVSILTRRERRVQPVRVDGARDPAWLVSILTRRERRVQPASDAAPDDTAAFQSSPGANAGCNGVMTMTPLLRERLFQSSPGANAGCNFNRAPDPSTSKRFQSSPGANAGCNCGSAAQTSAGRVDRFNPHPARTPGATSNQALMVSRTSTFQSSPGANAGCNRCGTCRPV